MRICFVTPEFVSEESCYDGGLANYLYRTSLSLLQFGHVPIVVIASDRDEIIYFNDIELHRVKTFDYIYHQLITSTQWLYVSYVLNKYINEKLLNRNIDIIQYTNHWATGFFRTKLIPSVVRISGYRPLLDKHYNIPQNEERSICNSIEITALRNADSVFCPSRIISEIIKNEENIDSEIIESPFINDVKQLDRSIFECYLKEKKYLLFFGTIGTLKGLLTIAEILFELLDKNRDLNFVFVGREEDSLDKRIVQLLFKNAGIYKDRVFRFDRMAHSKLYPIIDQAYAVVLPSLIDNFPNACIEALAHGRIVIGTKDTGFEQLIENGGNGYLCEKDNPVELLNTIQKVLSLSKNEKLKIEKDAFNSINKLSPQYIVPKLILLYQKTIQNYNLNNGILKIEKGQEFFYSLIFRQLNDLNQIITDKQILINNLLHSKSYRFGYFVIHPLVEFKQYSQNLIKRVKQKIKKRLGWFYLKRQIKFNQNNKKINLLFFIPWMVVGGAEKVALDIISKLDKSVFSIHIITTNIAEHVWAYKFNDYTDNTWHLPEMMDAKFYGRFIKYLISKLKINVVFISNSSIGYEYLPVIKKKYPFIKVFDLLHGQGGKSENGGFPLFSSKFDKYINKKIVINNYLKKHIIENYNIEPHKISVIYNGIDIDYFNPDKVENDFFRNKYGLNHNNIIISFVGRLSEEKHPENVIELAQLFKAEGYDRFYFFIAGSGNKYDEIFQLIEKKNLNQHVFQLGELDDIRKLLKDTDILYLCSEMEGLPIVVLEAMSMGVPVVASNVGGLPEMIDNGENGILVDYDKNFILNSKNAILELLDKKKVIAQNNIKKADAIFSLEHMIKTYQKVILENNNKLYEGKY